MPESNPNVIAPDCICHTYEANPPGDPRLPQLHQALHHAQQAFDAMVAAQQPDIQAKSQDDYGHYTRDCKEYLATAAQKVDRTITLVEYGRI